MRGQKKFPITKNIYVELNNYWWIYTWLRKAIKLKIKYKKKFFIIKIIEKE